MTAQHAKAEVRLPIGASAILPTIWTAFVVTVVLALAFSFGNVWDLGRTLHVERHVAPLIGPAVDFTAIGLLVVVPWLVLAGVSAAELRSAMRLMRLAGALTLALNSAPSAIKGWIHHDPSAWGRAAVEAIVPLLLIAWSHVGPTLIALFVGLRQRHAERLAEAHRIAAEHSAEAVAKRAEEIRAAVDAALRGASAEWEARLVEERHAVAGEVSAKFVAELAEVRESDERHAHALADAIASGQQIAADLAASTAEVERLRKRLDRVSGKAPRGGSARRSGGSVESAAPAPRKSAAELLEERVEVAKEALPTWQIETPSGPEIRSALGIKSDGVISEIRKRIESDRLALAAEGGK